jgi:segregation and condensation protein B
MSKRKKKNAADAASETAAPEPAMTTDDLTPVTQSDAFSEEEDTVVSPPVVESLAVAGDDWEGPTRESATAELAELAAKSVETPESEPAAVGREAAAPEGEPALVEGASGAAEGEPAVDDREPAIEGVEGEAAAEGEWAAVEGGASEPVPSEDEAAPMAPGGRLESVLESLLFASDRPLTLTDLKRLVGERDGGKLTAALEALRSRRAESGIQVLSVAGGWHLRTNPENVAWVSRLIAGRPQRLSRAMLETLSIVAYRQPITRPEIDEIRGVDCGPVLKTLLDRNLVRMIGKKEEAGRPILYGTTPEFLRTFSLADLSQLPTLREFHELGVAEAEKVAAIDAEARQGAEPVPTSVPQPTPLPPEPAEDDQLLSELEAAAAAADAAAKPMTDPSHDPQAGSDAAEPPGDHA